MAAGNNNGGERGTSNENASTSKGAAVPDKLVIGQTKAALQNNNHIADEWTPEEQSALEELLDKYVADFLCCLFSFVYVIVMFVEACCFDM